jgi:hypothetical protein
MRTVSGDPETAARAADVNAAYEILGDPERRAHFDNNLSNILNGWTDRRIWGLYRTLWCAQCGRELHHGDVLSPSRVRGKRKDALYCSNACRQRAYRARKAALKRLPPAE